MHPGAGKHVPCALILQNLNWFLLLVTGFYAPLFVAGYESASYAGQANMGRQESRSVASAGELGMDQKAFEGETNSTGGIPARAAEAPDLLW